MPSVLKFSVWLFAWIALPGFPASADEPARKPLSVFKDCEVCPEMIVIPPGSFFMGSVFGDSTEMPVHRVTIAYPFAIGRAEVKVWEWKACVADGNCDIVDTFFTQSPDDYPQTGISWPMAKDYAAWLSEKTGGTYRLPSEAEWEYAARGGTQTRFWWGANFKENYANCEYCGTNKDVVGLRPAGTFPPNPYGLYDVSGNLYEWIEDCWNPSFKGAPTDGSSWLEGECRLRVIKGGSRMSYAKGIRPAYRYRIHGGGTSGNNHGFRVLRELP
ncbi:MAG: formylglycine-generating enzyme family protein [Rhodospirillaceae bacterium]|nr:formylglycine-generating enzyme family protein [Rhodospirillaceae bacterium]MBT5244046.1 formylglycine-generating enzyme family protein [Rhodospirillaceae bacterium]MBT5560866.1 formylglycine-generating enzyme family protein [Rhodospirillaceae bacterium]MBT6241155.1 formylglycine-generating enzyme family protein [Rhodospirillaceae bacterium]MBT7138327.1 formylglycine-generating enzyme family protein [Rhodospirillaceae bacterium]